MAYISMFGKMKRRMFSVAFFFFYFCMVAQNTFSVMSYNCENAFDTIHDEGKNDYEYVDGGNRHWSVARMRKKLNGIAKVIAASNVEHPVDLVGLCEVENDTVLSYLTQRTNLRNFGYKYVMTKSNDSRGVDVALLYSPFTFRLLNSRSFCVETSVAVRDVLYVSGVVHNGDTLDVYVCHLPSKLGGKAAEQRSMAMARRLKTDVDSIFTVRVSPNIIIMGDFNADCQSPQLRKVLGIVPVSESSVQSNILVDLIEGRKNGTYKYRGQWSIIDHIIVSGNLLSQQSFFTTSYNDSGIHTFPFLLEDDKTYGGKKPFRTYNYMKYNGGISDHLPVWARFRMKSY